MIRRGITLVRQLWAIQFLRFLVVGGLNTVFGYSVFAVFILLNLPYPLAALLGHTCGVLFNFKTYGLLVFKNKDNRLIFKFVGVYVFTYFLTVGLLWVFNLYGVHNLIAGAIIILPVASVAFILNRRLVFRILRKK